MEILMRVERLFPFRGSDSLARPVRQDPKALLVVHQVGFHDLIEHVLMNGGIEQRNERLDAPIKIALHEIGGRNENARFRMRQPMAGAERIDARVLQEAADERLHANIVGQPGHARPQAANSAYHDVDLHARAAGRIESVDDLRIDERVAFHPDLRRAGQARHESISSAILRSSVFLSVIGEIDICSRPSGSA